MANRWANAPPAFPAAYPGVIAVTAVTREKKAYQRANQGAYIAMAAPGVHIWTASADGKIKIKFISVVEDSRCPMNVACIWAGNVKIKIAVSKGRKAAKTYEINSGLDPRVLTVNGYEITFVDLSPRPGELLKMRAFPPTVTLSVKKAGR